MTPVKMAANIRFHTRTDAATFSDEDIILLLEARTDEIALRILEVNENYFGNPELRDLQAGKREYPFPIDILTQMKYLEAKLDGTNYIKLSEMDLNQYKGVTDEATIVGNFSNTQDHAFYDIFRNSLFLYTGAIIDVEDGLKLWTFNYPAYIEDLTSDIDVSEPPSTIEHGFPRAFHELLCRGVRIDYKSSRQEPIPLSEHELNYEKDLEKKLELVKPINLDRSFQAQIPSSASRGNEGADY